MSSQLAALARDSFARAIDARLTRMLEEQSGPEPVYVPPTYAPRRVPQRASDAIRAGWTPYGSRTSVR